MDRLIAIAALVGFVLSLAVHISALSGIDVSAHLPFVWLLHVGIFVVFVPFVLSSRKYLGTKPTFSEVRAAFPGWAIAVFIAIFAYALVNFLIFMAATEGGSPSIRDGKYVLDSHGKVIRELTEAEYFSFKANELRGFSGHWLVFYFAPFAYFMFRKKSNPPLNSDAPKGGAPFS